MKIEYKSIPMQIEDYDDKKGIIVGHYSIYNIVDDGKDLILPGAGKKSISENGPGAKNRVKHLFNHDPNYILGKPTQLTESEIGGRFESKFSMTDLGKRVFQWHIDGVVDEFSMGYKTIKDNYRPDGVREIIEYKLWEISSVTWAMNEYAKMIEAKSTSFEQIETKISAFEKALKNPKYIDNDLYIMEMQLNELKQLFEQIKPKEVEKKSWLSYMNAPTWKE